MNRHRQWVLLAGLQSGARQAGPRFGSLDLLRLLRSHWFTAVALAAMAGSAVACGSDTGNAADATTAKPDVKADTAVGGNDTAPVEDISQPEDAPLCTDACADTGPDAAVTAKDGDAAAGTVCTNDDMCAKFAVKKCEKPACDLGSGTCKAVKNPQLCCDDTDCDDQNKCTDEKCNVDTAKCEYTPKQQCCEGQATLLKLDFEQKSLEGFSTADGPTNGNVKWHVETKRAHSGKYSLYFGNECYTYDASQTQQTSCLGGGTGGAVSTKLKSTTLNLTAGKQFMLHFWLWLDSEPSWLKSLPKGNCNPPCAADSSCVNSTELPNKCLPEKDVLKIGINGVPIDWSSLAIGKSTNGQWQHIAVDLAKWSGQGVAISWEFNTGTNGLKNNFEGIYLDDIRVESVCASNSEGKDVTCDATKKCADDKNVCTTDECTTFVNGANSAGLCFGDKIPGCCAASADCNDLNDCTLDSCVKPTGAPQGKCKNVPNAANAQCCKPQNLLHDDFGNGNSAWTKTESSKTVVWQNDPKGGTNDSPALHFSDATFSSYDDASMKPKGPSGIICSKTLSLPTGTLYNVASFKLNLSTEWDGTPKDKYKNPAIAGEPKVDELRVVLMTAGQYCGISECKAPGTGLPEGLWSSDLIGGTTGGKFIPVSVPLDKYAGKDVQLCFAFDAGDNASNNFKGPIIDDVDVDITCVDSPCSDDSMCDGKCAECEAGVCQDGACLCVPMDPQQCCLSDAKCDDADTCTTDKCESKKCTHTLTSATCCSDKQTVNEGFDNSDGKLPNGWKSSFLKGNPPVSGGKPYSTLVGWSVSPVKVKSPSYSLYFGTNGVTYNAGNEVPAAVVRSPDIDIPKNGTTLLTFQLYLSTEWDPPANDPKFVFKAPPDPIYTDRLRIGAYDIAETNPDKASAWWWNSYAIEGSTNGAWQSVVIQVPEAWQGKKVKLQFEFDAGTVSNNNYAGAFIDDLQLSTVCTKPTCVADAACVPAKPDACKKYFCSKDAKTMTFACESTFKPGPGCCAPSVALPVQTFETGTLNGSGWVPSGGSGNVKWQVIAKKYGNGKYEAYFGDESKFNYADGTNGVSGSLTTEKAVTLSFDEKNAAQLQFKLYADIEKSFEVFQIRVSIPGTAVQNEVVWSHTNKADFDWDKEKKTLVDKKVDLSKYKGKGAILVEFFFDSQDGLNNDQYQGIFLDDISIQEPCLQ